MIKLEKFVDFCSLALPKVSMVGITRAFKGIKDKEKFSGDAAIGSRPKDSAIVTISCRDRNLKICNYSLFAKELAVLDSSCSLVQLSSTHSGGCTVHTVHEHQAGKL